MGSVRRPLIWKIWRWLVGLALIPACVGVSWAVEDLLAQVGRLSQFWIPALAGMAAWLVLFLSLPKPLWLYVVGHELTHALWAILCGGKVKRFKASAKGGHVVVTKTNLLITLSPYFFPLYAVLWVLVFAVGDWLWNWRAWLAWFHFGLGVAYAFHLTLTVHILRQRQPDLESEGWFFSAVIIWLGNALTLLVALPALTRVVPIWTAFTFAADRTSRFIHGLAKLF